MNRWQLAGFAVGGREVVVVEERPSRHAPDLWLVTYRDPADPNSCHNGSRGYYLSVGDHLGPDGTWQHHVNYEDINGYPSAEAAIAFAAQFRGDRPQGIKLPFQIAGEDVWVCGDRRKYPGWMQGISGDFYVANGPEGRSTKILAGTSAAWVDLNYQNQGGRWYTYSTARTAAHDACLAAGVPQVDIASLPAPAPAPVAKVVPPLETLLGKTLLALLRLPKPPDNIQGLILQKTSLPVPAEACQSEAALTEWLRVNYTPPKGKVATPARRSDSRYSVDVTYSEREHGQARWSRTVTYSGSETFTDNDLADLVRDCSDRAEMEEAIEQAIMDERNGDYDEEDDTGYDYDDHETTDSDGAEDVEVNGIRRLLDEFLANNPEYDPDYEEEEEEEEEEDEDEEEGALEVERPFEVGQRVVGCGIQSHHDITGMVGTVVATGIVSVLVEFDEERNWLHSGDDSARPGHCWYCYSHTIRPLLEPVTA